MYVSMYVCMYENIYIYIHIRSVNDPLRSIKYDPKVLGWMYSFSGPKYRGNFKFKGMGYILC